MSTTEEARTPGQVARDAFFQGRDEGISWDDISEVSKADWERAALAAPRAWPASYQETFDAIAAATKIQAGMISVSVRDFYRALSYPDRPSTPAPSSPDGLDNLRKLSEAASPDWRTNDATPYILGPPIDGDSDRFEVIARGPAGCNKDHDRARQWQADRMFAVAAVKHVRTLISTHPAGQSTGPGADGWLSIETAPKDGTRIDLWVVPHDAFANGNADRLEARWMERVGWVRIGGGYVSECGEPTHWRPRPSAPGKPTPDSTRTGQVGTEEAVRSALGRFLFKRFETVEGFGEAHEELVRDLVALAARPAAPEAQGAWQDISTAPKDGTKLLLCVAGYEPCIGGWFEKRWLSFDPESFDHETLTKWLEDTTYEPTDWMPAPPSSGQGGR